MVLAALGSSRWWGGGPGALSLDVALFQASLKDDVPALAALLA